MWWHTHAHTQIHTRPHALMNMITCEMTDLFVCGSRVLSLAQFINSTARGLLTNAVPAHANYWTMVSFKPQNRARVGRRALLLLLWFFPLSVKTGEKRLKVSKLKSLRLFVAWSACCNANEVIVTNLNPLFLHTQFIGIKINHIFVNSDIPEIRI